MRNDYIKFHFFSVDEMIIFEDQVDDECGKSHINVSAAFALVLNEYDNDKKDNVHFQSLFILSVRVRRPRYVQSLPLRENATFTATPSGASGNPHCQIYLYIYPFIYFYIYLYWSLW